MMSASGNNEVTIKICNVAKVLMNKSIFCNLEMYDLVAYSPLHFSPK